MRILPTESYQPKIHFSKDAEWLGEELENATLSAHSSYSFNIRHIQGKPHDYECRSLKKHWHLRGSLEPEHHIPIESSLLGGFGSRFCTVKVFSTHRPDMHFLSWVSSNTRDVNHKSPIALVTTLVIHPPSPRLFYLPLQLPRYRYLIYSHIRLTFVYAGNALQVRSWGHCLTMTGWNFQIISQFFSCDNSWFIYYYLLWPMTQRVPIAYKPAITSHGGPFRHLETVANEHVRLLSWLLCILFLVWT